MKPSTILKIIIGFIALSLGAIGIILPVWPTTPFVLLAVACFSSTPKIRNKILSISFFREYYESYTKKQGLQKRTVMLSLTFLWVMLIISALASQRLVVTVILAMVGIAVTVHILWMSKPREKINLSEDGYE